MIHTIIRSKRRTIALQIAPDATLIVRAPERTSLETIHQIVRRKLPWILKKQKMVRENGPLPVQRKFIDGETFLYLGRPYPLRIDRNGHRELTFDGEKFLLSDQPMFDASRRFETWYRRQAFDVIRERVKMYTDFTSLKCQSVKITGAKKRWGSCSAKGALNFSWRLIMAPLEVVDYVVIHEIMHLEEPNHSRKFWQKVERWFPQYRETRKWLRTNQNSLTF